MCIGYPPTGPRKFVLGTAATSAGMLGWIFLSMLADVELTWLGLGFGFGSGFGFELGLGALRRKRLRRGIGAGRLCERGWCRTARVVSNALDINPTRAIGQMHADQRAL